MSPLDDELRAALHGRAQVLTPSPDPLAGIEQRARRMRRHRAGAAVVGSALAVALVAVAVPAVQSAIAPRTDVPDVAASNPPAADLDLSRYALDPEDPWQFRGNPVSDSDRAMIQREYATRTGGAEVRVTPLYGGFFESAGRNEVVFLAAVDGRDRWGIATYPTEAGLEIAWDEPLPEPALALAAALPGDEVPRLVVVTTPKAGRMLYGTQGSDESSFDGAVPGVGVTPLERDLATDFYRVFADGDELVRADAPDPRDITQVEPTEPRTGAALDPERPWELRGDPSLLEDGDLPAIGRDWAGRKGLDAGGVTVVPLYVQPYEPAAAVEVVYLVRGGSGPWSWGVSAKAGDGVWRWYVDRPLEDGTEALPAVLPGDEGVDRLLLVAAPFAGGAVYAADGSSYEPMADLAAGVLITPVAPGDPDDRFRVLDGNGDLDDPVVEGDVPDLQNAG